MKTKTTKFINPLKFKKMGNKEKNGRVDAKLIEIENRIQQIMNFADANGVKLSIACIFRKNETVGNAFGVVNYSRIKSLIELSELIEENFADAIEEN